MLQDKARQKILAQLYRFLITKSLSVNERRAMTFPHTCDHVTSLVWD